LNYLLQLNKKIVITFTGLLFIFIIIFITFKLRNQPKNEKLVENLIIDTSYDVSNPKFTINNLKQKIIVSANKGNFKNNDEILLQENVILKSENFEIFSDYVVFNKKDESANSNNNSIFIAKGTRIESNGFNIGQKGNIIKFKGKTKVVLTK